MDHPVKQISREKVLEQIEFNLTYKASCDNSDTINLNAKLEYHIRAACLIELLEEQDCGTAGGFGRRKNLCQEDTKYQHSLEGRYKWLRDAFKGKRGQKKGSIVSD